MVDYNILASVIIALLGGGAFVKLVELFLNRSKTSIEISRNEKENLRNDIISLRKDIQEMREEIAYLRRKLNEKTIELAKSTKKFFALKLVIEKIVIYLRSMELFTGDDRLEALIKDAYNLMEEEMTDD
jgi:chromosome segregation ATPase